MLSNHYRTFPVCVIFDINLLFFPQNTESSERRLPTSYVLELLTISRWEQIRSPESFSVKSLFKDIMMQLTNFGNINVAWSDYYDRRHFRDARQKQPGK